jgi:hypothetical protein
MKGEHLRTLRADAFHEVPRLLNALMDALLAQQLEQSTLRDGNGDAVRLVRQRL